VAAGSEQPPYGSYAAIIGGFAGLVAATAALERRLARPPDTTGALDLVLLCAATFKGARAISRERVGSVVREPFVETQGTKEDAHAETPVVERPAGQGLQRALGELVTCTRCAGTWVAAGLLATQTAAPRFGRLLTWTLAAGAGNDFLHAGFAALCEHANQNGAAAGHETRPRRPR
jgi:hypothetical protein